MIDNSEISVNNHILSIMTESISRWDLYIICFTFFSIDYIYCCIWICPNFIQFNSDILKFVLYRLQRDQHLEVICRKIIFKLIFLQKLENFLVKWYVFVYLWKISFTSEFKSAEEHETKHLNKSNLTLRKYFCFINFIKSKSIIIVFGV